MDNRAKHLYEFGPFRLDVTERVLLRDEEEVALTPKVFEILLALIEHRGHLVEKNELMEKVWPDSFVEEANLTQNISLLRKALGESSGAPQFIATVPKRGYRFIADVRETRLEGRELVVEERTRSQVIIRREELSNGASRGLAARLKRLLPARLAVSLARSSSRQMEGHTALSRDARRWSVAAGGLLAGLLIAGAVWWYIHRPPTPSESALRSGLSITTPVNEKISSGGGISRAAFSPDGKLIAYDLSSDEGSQIWVKQLVGGEPRKVTDGKWRDRRPIWSLDGQYLTFTSDRGGTPGIWSVPYLGGTPGLLKELAPAGISLIGWSKHSQTIYYELRPNLYTLELVSGQTTQLTNFDPQHSSARHFRVSPDEEQIAYADSIAGKFHILVKPLHGGEPRPITHGEGGNFYPAWFPDGKRLAYISNRTDIYQICIAWLDGREPAQITFGDDDYGTLVVSPDGTRILALAEKENANIFSCDHQTGEEIGQTSDFGLQLFPEVSPDGERIAFQSSHANVSMNESIIIKPSAAGSQPMQLTPGFDAKWSPEGETLAFIRYSASKSEIWKVSASGRNEKQLTSGGMLFGGTTPPPFNRLATNYNWSPDGTKIAYISEKSGQRNLWIISSDGSNDTMISNNTDQNLKLTSPFWSPDSSRIAYVSEPMSSSAGEKTRSVCMTEQGKTGTVFKSNAPLRLIGWSASGKEIFVALGESEIHTPPQEVSLLRISANQEKPETIARVPAAYLHNIKLSRDGQSIALVSRQDGRDNVNVVPTSGGLVKKITSNSDPTVYYSGLTWSPDGKTLLYSKQTSWALVVMIENFK